MKRRNTAQRQELLAILQRVRIHPTADWLYEEVRKTVPSVSKGTIYRNLKVLEEMGLISELKVDGNRHRYEYNRGNHSHFHCEECGTVMDVDPLFDGDLDSRFTSATGLKVAHHHLEFHGICQNCQKTTTDNRRR